MRILKLKFCNILIEKLSKSRQRELNKAYIGLVRLRSYGRPDEITEPGANYGEYHECRWRA